jgi:ribosomal protein L37AE/L43A
MDDNVCDNCGKKVKNLYTREGFLMLYYIEWVCEKCFKKLEGVKFEDFSEANYYGGEE